MASFCRPSDSPLRESYETQEPFGGRVEPTTSKWRIFLDNFKFPHQSSKSEGSSDRAADEKMRPARWSLGILNDRQTEEVPGTSLPLSTERPNCCENLAALLCTGLIEATDLVV